MPLPAYTFVGSRTESCPQSFVVGEDCIASALEEFLIVLADCLVTVCLEPFQIVLLFSGSELIF